MYGVNDGSQLLYLYCDIASFTAVGHAKAPLLRVCNTSGKYGNMIRTIFTHPHYVLVARREIESIEININTEFGKLTPFVCGKSVVTLHFRRRHSLLPSSRGSHIAASLVDTCLISTMHVSERAVEIFQSMLAGIAREVMDSGT